MLKRTSIPNLLLPLLYKQPSKVAFTGRGNTEEEAKVAAEAKCSFWLKSIKKQGKLPGIILQASSSAVNAVYWKYEITVEYNRSSIAG